MTDEEYEMIKGHVEASIDIIRHLPSLDYVIPAVIGHHERYDGHGYPNGYAGTEIPVGARIIAICDSIDAMTSTRSYRKAHDFDYCYAEIEKNLGRMYDPIIGRYVLEHWNEVVSVVKNKDCTE